MVYRYIHSNWPTSERNGTWTQWSIDLLSAKFFYICTQKTWNEIIKLLSNDRLFSKPVSRIDSAISFITSVLILRLVSKVTSVVISLLSSFSCMPYGVLYYEIIILFRKKTKIRSRVIVCKQPVPCYSNATLTIYIYICIYIYIYIYIYWQILCEYARQTNESWFSRVH